MCPLNGFEHSRIELYSLIDDDKESERLFHHYKNLNTRQDLNKKDKSFYFLITSEANNIYIKPNYYIGLDWVCKENRKSVYIAPKVNKQLMEDFETSIETENEKKVTDLNAVVPKELNYLQMLLEAMRDPLVAAELDGLLYIDWNDEKINISSRDEILTPFMVIQFLSLLKKIVKKGLKQSYYKVKDNLNSRIKGKILAGENIRTNITKNKLAQTICEYQQYGIDNLDNRFLKKVLRFIQHYVSINEKFLNTALTEIQQLINYSFPAFENVSDNMQDNELKYYKGHVLFKEYMEAIKIGEYILKRYSYSISKIEDKEIATPPFWIDMSRLFELYVYQQLLHLFPGNVKYHYSTYGNELDFLITHPEHKMVVDAKYKLHYVHKNNHDDIRQVSGYARLNKVYKDLRLSDGLIDCLIVYPNISDGETCIPNFNLIKKEDKYKIKQYRNVYKVGINLPTISDFSKTCK